MRSGTLRALRLLPVLVALLGTVVACGGGAGGDGRKSVTMWMYPLSITDQSANQRFWADVEKRFEEQHPDVDLTVELQPWEGKDEKITTALASGKGPDLVLLIPDQVPQYATTRAIQPLDDVVQPFRDDLHPGALQGATYEDKVYFVPLYQTATLPVYNRRVLARIGVDQPPRTWSEIQQWVPRLAAEGYQTLDYSASTTVSLNQTFYLLLWQSGGRVFAEDGGSVAFNRPEGVRALQLLVDIHRQGGIPESQLTTVVDANASQYFKGRVALNHSVTLHHARRLQEAWGAENVLVGPPLDNGRQLGFGLPGGLALTSGSRAPEAAKEVLRFLARPDVLAELNQEFGYFPPRRSVQVDTSDPIAKAFADNLALMRGPEVHPAARQVMAKLAPQIQAALRGDKTPQQALDDAAREADAEIRRATS